jgi:hypothetical protein
MSMIDQPHEIASWATLLSAAVSVPAGYADAVSWPVVALAALSLACLTGSRLSAGPIDADFDPPPDSPPE